MRPREIPIGRYIYTFRLWPTVMTVLMVAAMVALGCWQVQRMHWKENLLRDIADHMGAAPMDAEDMHASDAAETLNYRPAIASGVFQHDKTVFLHSISRAGEGGYHVLVPMLLPDGRTLVIDRGWVPFEARTSGLFEKPERQQTVIGILRAPEHGWIQPDNNPSEDEWFWVDLPALARQFDSAAPDFPVFLAVGMPGADQPKGVLPVASQTLVNLPNNHFSYIITWFSLAFGLIIIYGAWSIRPVK